MTARTLGLVALCLMFAAPLRAATPVGLFEDHADLGGPARAGAASFDSATKTYKITGGGVNMWATADAFQFAWKKMSGDMMLSAGIKWPAPGKTAHRKACLIIRQSLEAGSPYVDAALHGDGLTSLQYREAAGDVTHEIQSNVKGPARLRLEKQGDTVFMSVAGEGENFRHAGGSIRIPFQEPFYVGLAVCAHNDAELETAEFSGVELTNTPEKFVLAKKGQVESALEVIDVAKGDRRVVYQTAEHIEAPNWTRDGKAFLFNSKGRIYRLPVEGGEPQAVETGDVTQCNNDHGISFDGTTLAISSRDAKSGKSLIYTLPVAGGAPKQVTPVGHSYWHGWSPDGKTLVFCGERGGEFDVYAIPAAGGEEKRLTTAEGLDDGPEYSPDGQYIYFNSVRSGTMQIWRMRPDGSAQEQVTRDEYNNWFAHPSPDGKWLAFISFDQSVSPKEHPPNKNVLVRVMPVGGGEIRTIARVFGGQGTMNVPSWSPDSKSIAMVSYILLNE